MMAPVGGSLSLDPPDTGAARPARPVRLALVGLGQIATTRHLPAITADPDFELVAVATKGGTEAVPGLPVFDDHVAMLAAMPEIEAVAVCTPPPARHQVARDALLSGRHVLLEKPTTATLAEAEDLRQVAAGTGLTLFATWHSQFNAAVSKAHELLRDRRVVRMDVQWREDVERYHPGQDWIWRPGGFGVFDPGINALSIVTAIFPAPLFVHACRVLVQPGHETPIAAALRFGSVHEAELSAFFDWRPGPDIRTVEITTEEGRSLSLLDSGRRLLLDGEEVLSHANSEYPQIYRRFAALVARGEPDYDIAPQRLVADAFSFASPGLR